VDSKLRLLGQSRCCACLRPLGHPDFFHLPRKQTIDLLQVITLTHITCETPMFFSTGRLQMEIDILDETNNGTNRTLAGYLYVITPSDNAYKLNVNFLSNGSLYFTWNPSDINWGGTNSREKGVEDIAKLIFVHVCKKVVNGIDFCIKHPWFCGLSVAAVVLAPEITVPEEIIGGLVWTPAFAMHVKDGTLNELCNTDPDEGLCTSTFYMTKPDCEDITSANCPRPLAARSKDGKNFVFSIELFILFSYGETVKFKSFSTRITL
jgi:hypothetical protein